MTQILLKCLGVTFGASFVLAVAILLNPTLLKDKQRSSVALRLGIGMAGTIEVISLGLIVHASIAKKGSRLQSSQDQQITLLPPEAEIRQEFGEREPETPTTLEVYSICKNCQYFCGETFRSDEGTLCTLVCAVHPDGPPNKTYCVDKKGVFTYLIVRIQGFMPDLWLIPEPSKGSLIEMANAIHLDPLRNYKKLSAYFQVRSVNGLPGKRFVCEFQCVDEAFEKLLMEASASSED